MSLRQKCCETTPQSFPKGDEEIRLSIVGAFFGSFKRSNIDWVEKICFVLGYGIFENFMNIKK